MLWTPNQPIKKLPTRICDFFAGEAGYLLQELEENQLIVRLKPAPEPKFEGHMIRAVENRNPEWYRELYHSHKHFRKDRSLRALDRIQKKQDLPFRVSPYKYDSVYRELLLQRLTNGYSENGLEAPVHYAGRAFFRKKSVSALEELTA